MLKKKCNLSEVDVISLLEFRMAGYVTGRRTLYRSLSQLQAGEVLVWTEDLSTPTIERYFLFYCDEHTRAGEEDLVEELSEITNAIFNRVIEEAGGAPIWIPLSGGLDSRLVLCKLKELGYDNVTAFSYGPKGNYEAKAAKEVAERVGVPWHFVPVGMGEARRFFWSEGRRRYWRFADGLCSVPNMQDIQVLSMMMEKGLISHDCVIINGQSGDFITGGHIPASFMEDTPNVSLLLERIIDKHYSQWIHNASMWSVDNVSMTIWASGGFCLCGRRNTWIFGPVFRLNSSIGRGFIRPISTGLICMIVSKTSTRKYGDGLAPPSWSFQRRE